ncbi:MAG TPA: DNA methyltransferase [Candidatus Angelobacter sp.]|nr:DNA methyltransferase [Candidatus Angelobacter sp.]
MDINLERSGHQPIVQTKFDESRAALDNKLQPEDHVVHDWYQFVLSFPPHLVRHYLEKFKINSEKTVLDPFCGTGTTLVECKKLGIPSIGIEANPIARFATQTKINWNVDPCGFQKHALAVAEAARQKLDAQGLGEVDHLPLFSACRKAATKLLTLSSESAKLILKNSISPLPLHRTLVLLDALNTLDDPRFGAHERLALAKAVVFNISNLHFGPEVGVASPKCDAPVIAAWLKEIEEITNDLIQLRCRNHIPAVVYEADARCPLSVLQPNSVDAVITSPPYPNEKDYTRTTRLESVLLGFIKNKTDLRSLKENLIRSNTRNVYKNDQDDLLVAEHAEIQDLAKKIEARRLALGKTSGFERLYARVTKLYFGGMLRHLSELRTALRPGAHLAYVVGDQASYLRVMIRTGNLLADIAKSLGYELVDIELFRTRLATATKERLREEVIVLRWPGAGN